MMTILVKSVMAVFSGFVLSLFFGLFLIPFLRKKHASQCLSVYLERAHRSKVGTPTMGGFIFILPTFLITLFLILTGKMEVTYSLIIIIFTFLCYFIIGFIDDYLIIKRHNNKGLSKKQKFLMQLFVAVLFFYLFMLGDNEPLLWIHSLHFKVDIGFLYGIFILFILVASSNAVNITDGLNGLAGGLCVIAFFTFGVISWNTGWLLGYEDIAIFAFILVGSLLGFLLFNAGRALVFMGDTGSLCLGATLGAYAIITRHEVLLILIGIVFVLETLSCIIQIIYFKITGRRLFLMTPIHHAFEKKGMAEGDIVKLFWTIGLIGSMFALIYGVLL